MFQIKCSTLNKIMFRKAYTKKKYIRFPKKIIGSSRIYKRIKLQKTLLLLTSKEY
jgi:hypothetical protein